MSEDEIRRDRMNESESSENEFLATYDPSVFPRIGVTTDVVLFADAGGRLHVLLIERGDHPYKGRWALPGGFVEPEEDLEDAARRELAEETGVMLPAEALEQVRAYGMPGRDPRMRIVTIAFSAVVPDLPQVKGGSDAVRARFWPVHDLDLDTGAATPQGPSLAFDHHHIIADALRHAHCE